MNSSIGQMIFLATSVNEIIHKDSQIKSSRIITDCKSVRFYMSGDESDPVAQDPNEWMQFLRDQNVYGARLHVQPSKDTSIADRFSNAFVGGGSLWVIETPRKVDGSFCWVPKWNMIQEPDGVSWNVSYHGWKDISKSVQQNESTKSRLCDSFLAVQKFAKKNKLARWQEYFGNALDICLGTNKFDQEWMSTYIYDHQFTESQLQHFSAAFKGMVFGGMGSWNDLGFKSKRTTKKYEHLSEELYQSVCQSISELVSGAIHENRTE